MEHISGRPLTRRGTLLGLGGAGVAGALGLTGCSSAQTTSAPQTSASPSSSPVAATGIEDLAVGQDAVVRASLTTAWLKPDVDRGWTDEPVTQADPRPDEWLPRMDDTLQRGLLGRSDTQAALGSRVTVRELSGDWARVSFLDQAAPNDFGHQTSWVPRAHVVRDLGFLSAQQADGAPIMRVTAHSTGVYEGEDMEKTLVVVPLGTRLPLLEEGDEASKVLLPDEREGWIAAADTAVGEPALGTAEQVFETARSFEGTPYLWGGMSRFGIDCSGFTYTVLRAHGILLPRDSGPQLYDSGLPRVAADDLTPGDLLFYSHVPGGRRIRHVALYLGKGRGINAPFVGRPVTVETLEQLNAKHDYAGAVRPRYAQA
ncbi:C40 family peptidase [Micrococcus porci]|uniref:C40 family peptidase n=1 Tax=Micrococcus TaxID=1269 RepID=UPI001CCD1E13|nr:MULTISPECIES: C40 family peptidase [Micrococcus]MCG7422380.1 C40 family peptidase [Micrococcus sp. ACRRV]UBH24130.1 C40 family peptidase [Micrococcus porci]